MESCHLSGNFRNTVNLPEGVAKTADSGFSWISTHFSNSKNKFNDTAVKELSNLVLSHLYWTYPQISFLYMHMLLSKQQADGSFGDVRETSRAVSCLSTVLFNFQNHFDNNDMKKSKASAISYLLTQKKMWSELDDIYNTAYVLSALADAEIFQEEICLELCKRDLPEWKHPGTTALIITALQKQKKLGLFNEEADFMIFEFISKKIDWLMSVCDEGHWKYTASSCLVLNSLMICNQKFETKDSFLWLLNAQKENGSWENDLNTTALSLLTL